jgi:hypothetical protein
MNNETIIDHEVRIRMLERINQQLINRSNTLIIIVTTGFFLPVLIKYFWG